MTTKHTVKGCDVIDYVLLRHYLLVYDCTPIRHITVQSMVTVLKDSLFSGGVQDDLLVEVSKNKELAEHYKQSQMNSMHAKTQLTETLEQRSQLDESLRDHKQVWTNACIFMHYCILLLD